MAAFLKSPKNWRYNYGDFLFEEGGLGVAQFRRPSSCPATRVLRIAKKAKSRKLMKRPKAAWAVCRRAQRPVATPAHSRGSWDVSPSVGAEKVNASSQAIISTMVGSFAQR